MSEELQGLIYVICIYILFFGLIFVNYGSFAVTVRRWAKPPIMSPSVKKIQQPKLTIKEILPCYIPLYQVVIVKRELSGKCGVVTACSIISAVGIICNLFNKFVYAVNWQVMFVCNIIMLVSVFMFIMIYSVVTAWCARIYDFGWFCFLLSFMFPFLWCWYLHNNIPNKMRSIYKEEVFDEHMGGTVIKQRSN